MVIAIYTLLVATTSGTCEVRNLGASAAICPSNNSTTALIGTHRASRKSGRKAVDFGQPVERRAVARGLHPVVVGADAARVLGDPKQDADVTWQGRVPTIPCRVAERS